MKDQKQEMNSATLSYFDYLNKSSFIDEVETMFLSADLSVKKDEKKISDVLSELAAKGIHPSLDPSWFNIALVFASTTVATSILSKVTEDLYHQIKTSGIKALKNKARKNKRSQVEDETQIKPFLITITIETKDSKLSLEKDVFLPDDDLKPLLDVFQAFEKQLLQEAHKKDTNS